LLALCAHDWRPRAGWDEIRREHEEFTDFARQANARVAPDARLASAFGWQQALYLGRPVHSLRFAVRRAGNQDAAAERIDAERIDALVLYGALAADRPLMDWAIARYGAERVEPIGARGLVVHVRR
jgi:hypothetical protein